MKKVKPKKPNGFCEKPKKGKTKTMTKTMTKTKTKTKTLSLFFLESAKRKAAGRLFSRAHKQKTKKQKNKKMLTRG